MGELDAATAGRLRVRSPDGVVHGGGLLLTGTTAVTCAHVVTAALRGGPSEAPRAGPPRGHVLVERPAESGRPGVSETAEVSDGGWFVGPLSIEDRVNPAFRTDFAVLTLSRPFPHGTRTAVPGRCPASDGRTLKVFGYPKQAPHGLWVSARLVGAGGPCPVWRQLDVVADSGVGVEQGFSGSGVWDPRSQRMVGLVTAAFSRGGARIAWMLPLDAAADQWATLYAHFDVEPGGRGVVEGGGAGGRRNESRTDEDPSRQPAFRSPEVPGTHSTGGNVTLGQSPSTGRRPPQDASRLWGNVPQRNRNFTGREDLLELLAERLRTGIDAVLPEALHGMGGVGKSQIAVEYLYRHSHDYSLVWWIPAEQHNQVIQSLIELGDRMGLRAGSDVSAVRSVLEALRTGVPYRNWILVFDNAENPREIRRYFPTDGPGRILVTSRNAQWSSLASSLEVNVFAREESIALLRRRSPGIPDVPADQLATALGDLPLAVEQAAVWLAETGMPAHQYLELFERKWTELLRTDPPPDYEMPVAAAWNVSLERLQEDHLDALNLLQVCAFFAPEPISWDLFSAVRGVSVPEDLQATLEDPVKLARAVREIGRYALARIDHRQSTIQLHRLVQRVLVDQMSPDEQKTMRHAAHQLLVHADPRNPQRVPHWSRYSDLLPHVQVSNAVECGEPWTRRLVLNELRFLVARGDFSKAQSFSERARSCWAGRLGQEHADVLAADQVRAEALRCRGRYTDSYDLQKDLVDRFTRVHGEHHKDTQLALSLLGIHLRLRGDFYGARELDERTYSTSLRVFGPDEPNTLQAAHNYAVSLRLAGDVQAALQLDEETWRRRVEVIGEDHVFSLGTLSAYYLDLQELGRYADCLEGHEHLAARARDQLGDEHPLTVMISAELSATRRKAGDHEGAYQLTSRLREIAERRLAPDNRDALRVNLVHATDLRQVGQLQAARALGTDVMDRHIRKFGEQHPHTYATFLNLAVTLRLLGEVEQALELDQKALDGLSAALSPDHPRTLLARMNLASDLFALGNSTKAERIDRDAVPEASRVYGPDHPASLAVQLNHAADLKATGDTAAGRELHDKTLEKYRKQLGADHPATRGAKRGIRAHIDIDLLAL
ncbi:FxSxx-COOH system tetratricopeptide repeat protein [Streptomyces ortus]|uniref:FxSxx-COOH system tetratricopeptide repeat protein n=1 Tax=Streptomyces ortus TaxID=2867268 RepID=A0ABT3VCM2_9ACTN|nr:FxSxx-COOH system tetratricopeptide repeat protein [Streptomyces ortus]MCX4237306.1 FxSxx-COOH system tetratricopeptide repeat protein [Streptomyces ortus]